MSREFKQDRNDENIESRDSSNLSVSDWFSFLGNKSTNTLSNIMALGALVIACVALLKSGAVDEDPNYVLLVVFGIIVIGFLSMFIFNSLIGQGRIADRLLAKIINTKEKDPDSIREFWLDQTSQETKLRKNLALIVGVLLIVIILAYVLFLTLSHEPSPAVPCVEDAPYKIERQHKETIYTKEYQIQDGAIVIEGWYSDTDTYHDETLIILNDTVTIKDRNITD